MRVDYRYDELTNRLTTRCEGSVSLADVVEHFRKLGRDSRLKPRCDVVLDLEFLSTLPTVTQIDEVATIIEEMSDLMPFGRLGVIADQRVVYELGRLFQGVAWPLFAGIRVFRSHADAVGWLDRTR